jgi:hypothetical protein
MFWVCFPQQGYRDRVDKNSSFIGGWFQFSKVSAQPTRGKRKHAFHAVKKKHSHHMIVRTAEATSPKIIIM